MAHFTTVRTDLAAWSTSLPVDPDEFWQLDLNTFKSINGDDGGSWSPTSPITIANAGIILNGPATFNSFLYANGSLSVGGTLGATGAGQITGTWPGSPTFSGNPTFSGTVTFSGTPTITGTLSGSSATLGGSWTVSASLSSSGGSVGGTWGGNPIWSGNHLFSGTNTLSGTLTPTGAGRIRSRVVAGADANTTYSASDADIISIGNITGSHVYTIANGTTGEHLQIFKRSQVGTDTITINGTLHLGTGNTIMKNATAGDMYCVELDWDGSGWLMKEFYR